MKHKLFKAWEDSSRVAWILIRQTAKYLERYKFIPNEITTVQLIIAATLIHHSIYIQLTYSISVTTYNSSWITFWTSSLVPTMLDMLKSLCRLQKEGTCFERLVSPMAMDFTEWKELFHSFHQICCHVNFVPCIAPKIRYTFYGKFFFVFLNVCMRALFTVFMHRLVSIEGYWIVHLLLWK